MKSQIDALRQLTHELLYLGMDGEPIYADRFRQLNSDVYNQAEALYQKKKLGMMKKKRLFVLLS